MHPFVLLCAELIQKREIDDLFGVDRLQLLVHVGGHFDQILHRLGGRIERCLELACR